MNITIVPEGNKLVFRVAGELNFPEYKEWRVDAEHFLDTDADVHILDLKTLENVDSAGLGMMLAMKQWALDRGRKLCIRFDDSTVVGHMIRLAGFDKLFDLDTQ